MSNNHVDKGRTMADDMLIGKLIQQVADMERDIQTMSTQVQNLTDQMNKGKGLAVGILLAAGAVGSGITTAIHKLLP